MMTRKSMGILMTERGKRKSLSLADERKLIVHI